MPKSPNGEKRPADAVGLAVLIGRIATGEVEDVPEDDGKDPAAKALGAKGVKVQVAKVGDRTGKPNRQKPASASRDPQQGRHMHQRPPLGSTPRFAA